VQARLALYQPLIGLVIDSTLYECFLDKFACCVQRRRFFTPSFRPRHDRFLIEVVNRLGINLHSGSKTRIQVIAQVELRGRHFPHLRVAQPALFLPRLILLHRVERFPHSLHTALDLGVGWLGETRYVGLGSHDPLIDQPLENLAIRFRFSV